MAAIIKIIDLIQIRKISHKMTREKHIPIQRRKGTPSHSMTPPAREMRKGREETYAPTVKEDSIQNPLA